MESLDLHGIRHAEVKPLLIRFIEERWDSDTLCRIITGNSEAMKKIVAEVLDEYKLEYDLGGYLGLQMPHIDVTI